MTYSPAMTPDELYPVRAHESVLPDARIDIRMDYDPACPGALLTDRSILEAHGMPSDQAARLAQVIRAASDEWRASRSL